MKFYCYIYKQGVFYYRDIKLPTTKHTSYIRLYEQVYYSMIHVPRSTTKRSRRRRRDWPPSHPATNRNVYFTRRKLAPRARRERRHGCTALPLCIYTTALLFHPFRPWRSCLSRGRDAGYKFRRVRFNAPCARGTCAKPPVNECSGICAITVR